MCFNYAERVLLHPLLDSGVHGEGRTLCIDRWLVIAAASSADDLDEDEFHRMRITRTARQKEEERSA